MKKLPAILVMAFVIGAHAQVNQGGGAGSVQNPNAGGGGAALPHVQQMIGGKGDGNGVNMPEKGITVSGTTGTVAWSDDLNAGVYDPRDPRWGAQDTPAHQAAAIQAMSNQMACDLAMGNVSYARAKFPQGSFAIDQLKIAPGSTWEGTATSQGGTRWHSIYNNHQLAQAPAALTLTCSDGNSHTDSVNQTHVSHFTLQGCAQGGCSNAAGDTAIYGVGGPGNVGIEMSSIGSIIEYVTADAFGGYGIRLDGDDSKAFHNTLQTDLEWYYFGGYKGVGESPASPEISAVTTGSTGSVALSWIAVSGAAGYVVYRGTSAGNESVFYTTTTNSYTDTSAANNAGTVTNVNTSTTATPGTITATPSTTGGTLAAGTYYYKVTSYIADAWHGNFEATGPDNMTDWTETYGLFDSPTIFTYHHLADYYGAGGYTHADHIWAQLGQVGIAQPFGAGQNDTYENVRLDFQRLEGFLTDDQSVVVNGGQIDGACTASNAATINTGQVLSQLAGTCDQLLALGPNDKINNLVFSQNAGFGASQQTADYAISPGRATNIQGAAQYIGALGVLSGDYYSAATIPALTNVTGPTPSVQGLSQVNPNDSSAITYTNFTQIQQGQTFYVAGGNSNVTLEFNPPFLILCTGANINMGSVTGFLQFVYNGSGFFAKQVCGDAGTAGGVNYPAATATHIAGASITGGVTSLIDTSFTDDTTNTHDSEPFYLVGEYQQPTGTATSSANFVSNVTNWLISYWNGSTAVQASWNVYAWVAQGSSPPASVLTYYAPANLPVTAVLYAIDPGLLATSSINYNSPRFKVRGSCWNGTASVLDDWNWQSVPGTGATPTETLQFTNSGCGGAAQVELPGLKVDGPSLIGSGTSSNSDIDGEFSLSAATTASYTFANTYTSHPECVFTPQFSTTVAHWVTYTGTTAFTVNFASAVTGSVSYLCLSRN